MYGCVKTSHHDPDATPRMLEIKAKLLTDQCKIARLNTSLFIVPLSLYHLGNLQELYLLKTASV